MTAADTNRGKRIAKNTLMLYFRMLFMLFLGLFTSRIVLSALGEADYAVYNVVGGVVAMFTIISGALNSAVSRFITFEMGKGADAQLNKVYSTAVNIQVVLSVIVIVLAEPAGLWFIDNRMTIDPSRIPAARWVLQFSLLSFAVNLMSIPQMASITAHEKMSAYAYIGVLDGILRLAAALLISWSHSDRLILYAFLMFLSVLAVRLAYGLYCRMNFAECRYRPVLDKSLLKEMFSFA
jgi:O-antigen/teichoic acid export membrane protein